MSGHPVDVPLSAGYCEYPPPADLRDRVACTWVHRVGTAKEQPQPIIPDGCVDIVWTGTRLVVAGPATRPVFPDVRPGATKLGLRFRMGAAALGLGLPAAELR